MYAKGKGATVPSDNLAREKLALYVYEYLIHVGAQKAASTFLSEIRWEKSIALGEPPGFLHQWWGVFWDLYCAAPERRETFEHSTEAKAFHDYGFVNSGFPNGMSHNPAAPSPMNLPPQDPNGPPGPGPGMPPGFYQPHPGTPISQPGMMPLPPNSMEMRPGPHCMAPMQRVPMPPGGGPRMSMPGPPGPNGGPYGPPGGPMCSVRPGPMTPQQRVGSAGPPQGGPGVWAPVSHVTFNNGLPPSSGGPPPYSTASPVTFSNGPPQHGSGSGTPGIMPSPQDGSGSMDGMVCGPGGPGSNNGVMMPGRVMFPPGGPMHDSMQGMMGPGGEMCPPGGPHMMGPPMNGAGDGSPMPPMVSMSWHPGQQMPPVSGGLGIPPHLMQNGPPQPQHSMHDQDSAAILKIKESMQEDVKRFEKDMGDQDYFGLHQ